MRVLVASLLVSLCTATSASALGDFPQWVMGAWECQLDGRPATMEWRIVERPTVRHHDDGSASMGFISAAVGQLRDDGGPVAELTVVDSDHVRLRFQHPDGNVWLVRRGADGGLSGHSVWNRTRYPFACRRPQPPAPPPPPSPTLQSAPDRRVPTVQDALTPRQP